MASQRTRGLSAAQVLWSAGCRSVAQDLAGGRSPLNAVALASRCGRLVVLLLLACAMSTACGRRVVYVDSTDAEMNAAMAKARSSLDEFRRAVEHPRPGVTELAVKVAFVEGDATEHIWLEEPALDGQRFRGKVANDPVDITTVKLGQYVSFPGDRVSDWMYSEDGVLRGGFTLRLLLDRSPPAERARILAGLPFRVE